MGKGYRGCRAEWWKRDGGVALVSSGGIGVQGKKVGQS